MHSGAATGIWGVRVRKTLSLIISVPAALSLAACTGSTTTQDPRTPAAIEAPSAIAASPVASPLITPPPTSEGPPPSPTPLPSSTPSLVVTITCQGSNYDEVTFTDYRDAWSMQSDWCDGEWVSGLATPKLREAATQLWNGKSADQVSEGTLRKALAGIAASCAQSGPGTFDYTIGDVQDPEGELAAWRWQFTFCPDHPDRAEVIGLLKDVAADFAENPWFYGEGRVGKDFPPGTYVSRGNDDGCYWEITDRAGNIMTNNFSDSPRMQVTIPSSAYAFSSENCNKWRRA